MKTTTNFRTGRMVQLALFTAIIVLLAFTPLGYIKTGSLSITLIGIPVIVGAIVLGPTSGAFLGGVFGATSFIQCFIGDPFGAALLGISPVKTFLLCLIPRILMGWLTGIIFVALKRIDKKKYAAYAITSLSGSLLNTIFFMPLLIIFFYHSETIQNWAASLGTKNAFTFFFAAAGINAVLEAIVCLIVGTAVAKAVDTVAKRTA